MTVSHNRRTRFLRPMMLTALATSAAAIVTIQLTPLAAPTPANAPTYSKDVAPIFQKSCQSCHHAGTAAPMSLITYQDVRPWAKSIKARVVNREMPPWHLDKTVGIREYKNDISLRHEAIEPISRWADAGARQRAPQGMTPPLPCR